MFIPPLGKEFDGERFDFLLGSFCEMSTRILDRRKAGIEFHDTHQKIEPIYFRNIITGPDIFQ